MSSPTTAFVKQFGDTITLLAQQMESRLRSAVMVDTNWTGEEKYYDQYANDTFTEINSRYQDTPLDTPDHRRRRVTPSYFVSNTLEDPFEALQMLADPKSAYLQAKMSAANRKIDSVIITALGGTAYTGKSGSTAVTIAAGYKFTAAGGLVVANLITASKILNAAEGDKEDRSFVCSAEQMDDLLNTTGATSSDYNTVKTLVMGEIDTFVGFRFIHSEQLSTDTNSYRLCYAFQKKGVQLAIQKEPESRLTERPDKNYAWQVYMRLALGATRLEEERVVEVAVNES